VPVRYVLDLVDKYYLAEGLLLKKNYFTHCKKWFGFEKTANINLAAISTDLEK
jgi:hypothetical protein